MRFYSDKHIEWRPGRIYIPANHFTGLSVGAVNEGGSANNAYGALWAGANTGAPISKEISTFGMNGVLIEANGDVLDTCIMLPYDVDLNKHIRFAVWWTSGSADTADTMVWKVFYKGLVPNSTTLAAASTALDTTVASDDVLGAYTIQKTEYGILKGGTLAASTEAVALQVEGDSWDAGLAEDIFFIGLEMVYSPKRLRGPDGMGHEAKLPNTMLGSAYS